MPPTPAKGSIPDSAWAALEKTVRKAAPASEEAVLYAEHDRGGDSVALLTKVGAKKVVFSSGAGGGGHRSPLTS